MQTLSLELRSEPGVAAERPLFSGLLPPAHNWAPAAGVSLVLHFLALACTLLAQEYLPLFRPDSLDGLYTAKTYPLNMSQRLYYYVEPQARRRVPRGAAPVTPSGPAAQRRAYLRLPPGMSIPPLPEPPRVSSLVIQPSKGLADLLSPMPAISAWAPRERPAPKVFVQPGRARPLPDSPVLDAPPTLERPNTELRLSDMNFAAMPAVASPALPRPSSSTTPVRIIEPPKLPADVLNAGIGWREGDPVNLITAGTAIPPPNTYVSVPPGVAGGTAESAPSPSTVAAASKPGAGQGGAAGAPATELTAARDRTPPPGATRVARPKDGRYTFMVMGSKPDESFPEAAGMLSGKLVYTVYLGIGARPDWILQYCLPKSAPATGAGALAAPYPYLMFRPPLSSDWDEEYLFVHGMLNVEGKLERLEPVGEAGPVDKAAIVASLVRWEFRPAARGGKPAAVEVLLIVPRPQP
jgi:hypothetical protein